jgi:dihydrodipicolinate synthase/N-acetylneuraminate lyase
LAGGAIGTVSGMAAAFPDVVRQALDDPSPEAGDRLGHVRSIMEASGQFIAAAKHVLGMRGVPVQPDMRAPLRGLTPAEASALEASAAEVLALEPA